MLDRRLMARRLSRVSGMRKFRAFLEKTAGEKALLFWLDAERFRKNTHYPEEHRALFRQIEAKYFKHGGMLELPEHAKWLASIKSGKLNALFNSSSHVNRFHQIISKWVERFT